jgi:hypothetical protein
MNVIFHAADFDGRHFIRAGDAAEIRPETLSQRGRDQTPTFFGAPDAMQMTGNECVHFSVVPTGLGWFVIRPTHR